MTQPPNRTKSVLIVEDDPDTSLTLAEFLRNNGYRVSTAVDRDEAISILQTTKIDTVLLDYMMPGQSASRFLNQIRSTYPKTRVVLMTAGSRVESITKMLGVDDYIGKPILPDELLDILK
jgi:DNA-binding response OmpR family regulator